MAASALSSMGQGLSGLGMQGYGMGSGILGNVFNQGLAAREQQFNQGSQIGQGLFNAYQAYLFSRATGNDNSQTLPTSSGQGLYPPGYHPGNFTPGTTSSQSGGGGGSMILVYTVVSLYLILDLLGGIGPNEFLRRNVCWFW
jgi:hypothetical protein